MDRVMIVGGDGYCGFATALHLSRAGFESEEIADLAGLAKRSPWLAGVMTVFMFSLAGVPPMVGFYAKFAILQALITTNDTGYIVLAIVAVLLSLIGAYYYLRLVKVMYFDAPTRDEGLSRGRGVSALLAVNGAAVLVFGLLPGGLMAMCRDAILRALATGSAWQGPARAGPCCWCSRARLPMCWRCPAADSGVCIRQLC